MLQGFLDQPPIYLWGLWAIKPHKQICTAEYIYQFFTVSTASFAPGPVYFRQELQETANRKCIQHLHASAIIIIIIIIIIKWAFQKIVSKAKTSSTKLCQIIIRHRWILWSTYSDWFKDYTIINMTGDIFPTAKQILNIRTPKRTKSVEFGFAGMGEQRAGNESHVHHDKCSKLLVPVHPQIVIVQFHVIVSSIYIQVMHMHKTVYNTLTPSD